MALIALTVITAGCSSSNSTATEAASTPAAAADAAAGEGQTSYPYTLETPWGTSTLAERPTRIAAITSSQDDLEILAALGITPVLAADSPLEAWLVDKIDEADIEHRFAAGSGDVPMETILQAQPDLIVSLGSDLSETYSDLSAIAPVFSDVRAEGAESKSANDWSANVTNLGAALDLRDKAQQVLDTEAQSYREIAEAYPDFAGKTASYVVYYGQGGGLQYHSADGGPSETLFESIGLAPNPLAKEFEYRQEISLELANRIDSDIIIFADTSDGAAATVTSLPLFTNLPAVKAGQLLMVENQGTSFKLNGEEHQGNLPWALARGGPLSAIWAASLLAPAIQATLK